MRYPALSILPNELVIDLERAFQELSFSYPDARYMNAFAKALQRGLSGEKVTLVSPVCPDYGYESVKGKYRYTFDQLGDGIGLVASRVVKTLPVLQEILVRHGISTEVTVAAGDFEGLDTNTLTRVRETRVSFRKKIEVSQDKVGRAIGPDTRSLFISDAAGGEQSWLNMTDQAHQRLLAKDYGHIEGDSLDIAEILNARMPLYKEWHKDKNRQQLIEVLLAQAAEYSAMGQLFSNQLENPIVIGADHNLMQPFYWLHQPIPVLYLKRVY